METPIAIVEELIQIVTNIPPERRKRLDEIASFYHPRYQPSHPTFEELVKAMVTSQEVVPLGDQFLQQASSIIVLQSKGQVSELEAKRFFVTLGLAVVAHVDIHIRNTVWPPGSD